MPKVPRQPNSKGAEPINGLASRTGKGADGSDSRLVQEAVARTKDGDQEALHFLYVRYAADLLRYVNSFVKNRHESEDIVQDIFAKLTTSIGKYEQRDVPFTAWILRVAHNAALDHMRARRAILVEELRAAEVGRSEVSLEQRRHLRRALEQLPHEQCEVLVLRHVVRLSPGEIAEALGKSESSIHGLHHRGRRRLESNLSDLRAAPIVAL